MNLLFVCSRNQWRSPTAEKVWSRSPYVSVRSAGTSPRARRTITMKDVQWADLVLVMQDKHRQRVRDRFRDEVGKNNLVVLDIPDEYRFMDPELVQRVTDQVTRVLQSRGVLPQPTHSEP